MAWNNDYNSSIFSSFICKVSQSPGNLPFLKHAIRIHAARCRPSMADNGFKKGRLPGDCDKIVMEVIMLNKKTKLFRRYGNDICFGIRGL